MKPSDSSGIFRPFAGLKELLENRSIPLKNESKSSPALESDPEPDPKTDQALFHAEMADVRRIARDNCIEKNTATDLPAYSEPDTTAEVLSQLENLVKNGNGFVVADTPEYVEGTGYRVNPEVAKKLHRGDFSIQAHLDLHGLSVADAQEAFEHFLKESIATGKKGVLIIHGRGLSSPAEPILKTKVYQWLTNGPWRKWVIAFSSARLCDGGAGAIYVLLRSRPLTKRFKKGKKAHSARRNSPWRR